MEANKPLLEGWKWGEEKWMQVQEEPYFNLVWLNLCTYRQKGLVKKSSKKISFIFFSYIFQPPLKIHQDNKLNTGFGFFKTHNYKYQTLKELCKAYSCLVLPLPNLNEEEGRWSGCSVFALPSPEHLDRNRLWLLSAHGSLAEGWSMDFTSEALSGWKKIILPKIMARLSWTYGIRMWEKRTSS